MACKRKLDTENRKFNEDWTSQFAFILIRGKLTCLICQAKVAAIKKSNLQRHYQTHSEFDKKYPLNSAARSQKIGSLKVGLNQQASAMQQATSEQRRSTKAGIVVSSIIGKKMMPYSDSDTVKECLMAAAEELFPNKPDILQAFSSLALSRRTCTRRIEDIADQVLLQLLSELGQTEAFSIALDESTDIRDVAQLAVFVRYFDGQMFKEELLTIIGLEGKTTGCTLYDTLMKGLEDLKLNTEKIISVATDGAPAMVGRMQGLVARMKDKIPHLLAFHCIIHQSVLCAKLNDKFQSVMTTSMKLINFLKAKSALRHRQLRAFLESCETEHTDLLTHNEVRWLSKGNALARLWELQPQILLFLDENNIGNEFKEFLTSAGDMFNLVFMVDFFNCMNNLNLELQGKDRTIIDLWVSVKAFVAKLKLFCQDIGDEQNFFPTLREFVQDWGLWTTTDGVLDGFRQFIEKVQVEFASRFKQFESMDGILQLIANPRNVDMQGLWKDQLTELFPSIKGHQIQLELCYIQAADSVTDQTLTNPVLFWSNPVTTENCPVLSALAIKVLTIFGSTYQCEAMFSKLNAIKTGQRSCLTQDHLSQLLRVCCAEVATTDAAIEMVMTSKKNFHSSH